MHSIARALPSVARLLLGLIFTVFGLNGFLQFLPTPPLPPGAMAFVGGLAAAGYLLPLMKGIEVAAGLALLANRGVPLALAVLAPIVLNIVAFHTLLAPGGMGMALLLLALELYLAWAYRAAFAPMLRARVEPEAPTLAASAGRESSLTAMNPGLPGAVMTRRVLVCDFDGTLTLEDVGDALCAHFADPAWLEPLAQLKAGLLSLPEAQRRMWAHVRASRQELREHALRTSHLRPGLPRLLDAVREGRLELVLASGGFDVYIEPLLGERLGLFAASYYHRLLDREAGGVEPLFQHPELATERFAICKGRVVQALQASGARVAFCGDGHSDLSVVGAAELLFCVRGEALEADCRRLGAPHVPFDDLGELVDALEAWG